MAQENWQKYKLLKLLELLRQETDEQHPLATSALCNRLAEMGISCERRTLTKDIAVLNELGYEVMWNWVGKEKGYYIHFATTLALACVYLKSKKSSIPIILG